MKKIFAAIPVVAISISTLPGCSIFTSPTEHPAISDYQNHNFFRDRDFGTSSLTASRRMVLFKLSNKQYVCAEPPPQVGEELSRALQAAAAASAAKSVNEQSASVNANLLSTLSTTLVKLDKPKGIQYEQDMLYNLCQMTMNGQLGEEQTRSLFAQIAERSERILLSEIGEKNGASVMSTGVVGNESPLLSESNKTISLKVLDENALKAYHGIKVIYRVSLTGNENREWVVADATIKGDNKITAEIDISKLKGNDAAKPARIDIGLQVITKPDAKPTEYKAGTPSVYYPGKTHKAEAVVSDSQHLFAQGKPVGLTITLPQYASTSFPKFAPSVTTLLAKFKYSPEHAGAPGGEIYEISAPAPSPKITEGQWSYSITLPEDKGVLVDKARANEDISIEMKYMTDIGVPTIAPVVLNQWANPGSATNLKVVRLEGEDIKVTWDKSEAPDTVTYMVKVSSSTETKAVYEKELKETECTVPSVGRAKAYEITVTPKNFQRTGVVTSTKIEAESKK